MDNKQVVQPLDTVKDKLRLVRETNDLVIRETENLRIILLNLKIENARIKENTGISPICNALEKTIVSLHDSVKDVVDNHRKILIQAMNELETQINLNNK